MQHGNIMPKGNGFYELGIQPSLNAFFFSPKDPKPRDVVQRDPQCSLQESKHYIIMKEQLSIKLNIHLEVSTQKVVKIKAHKRIVNGKTVKVRSHYRVIEG